MVATNDSNVRKRVSNWDANVFALVWLRASGCQFQSSASIRVSISRERKVQSESSLMDFHS